MVSPWNCISWSQCICCSFYAIYIQGEHPCWPKLRVMFKHPGPCINMLYCIVTSLPYLLDVYVILCSCRLMLVTPGRSSAGKGAWWSCHMTTSLHILVRKSFLCVVIIHYFMFMYSYLHVYIMYILCSLV